MARRAQEQAKPTPLKIVLLSGGTGRTAESVLNSTLVQFDLENVRIVRRVGVREVGKALKVVHEAERQGAILCHSLVDPELRRAVVRESDLKMVPSIDVLGPALAVIEDSLHRSPKGRAGLSYELNKEQFDRIEAVDFTLAHDDGAMLRTLHRADVVLVGVSRVAKSVTCFYLAYRGVRAANVPIISGLPLPQELIEVDPNKVIGVTMNAQRLQSLRSARFPGTSHGALDNYVDSDEVSDELRYARRLMTEHGWRCIDVSYMAVEEAASEILHMIRS